MKGDTLSQLLICLQLMLFYEYRCQAETVDLTCTWGDAIDGRLAPYSGGTPRSQSGLTSTSKCRDLCVNQTSFLCSAVNHKNMTGECQLLAENDNTATVSSLNAGWTYFVRPLCAGIWLPWNVTKGQHLQDSKITPSTESNLKDCKTRCFKSQTDEECRSVTVSIGSTDSVNCELNSKRVGDNGSEFTPSTDWQTFSRPTWYLETSLGATQADIANHGTVGSALQILLNYSIPVSGYLVAWQYFGISGQSCTSSFAAIWRKLNETSYKQVSRTLLDKNTSAANIQFTRNSTIRVEKDDVISIMASQENIHCSNLISARTGGPLALIVRRAAQLARTFDDDVIVHSSIVETRTAALKAFVSEYLALKSAPFLYHNNSLTHRQIWLKLPPTLSGEDSVVVAGYRIICSTDIDLTQNVSCYDDLVSVNSTYIVLTLPDVTRPVYAAVQVIRNFNGEELPEEKYSNVSSMSCPYRDQSDKVTVVEYGDTGENLNVSVVVMEDFTDDLCADSIKLFVNTSRNTSFTRAVSDSRDHVTFNLTLDKGVSYGLTIYLQLADGYENLLWEGTYFVATASMKREPGQCTCGISSPYKAAAIGSSTALGVAIAAIVVLSVIIVKERVRIPNLQKSCKSCSERPDLPESRSVNLAMNEANDVIAAAGHYEMIQPNVSERESQASHEYDVINLNSDRKHYQNVPHEQ